MSVAGELYALAERCEAATGPDRELDARVHEAAWANTFEREPLTARELSDCPRYTASLDAAMTLVPEGCVVAVTNCDCDGRRPDFTKATAIVGPAENTGVAPTVAATPALALCAAALRARASQEPKK